MTRLSVRRRSGTERGFTLIETLVALAIAALALGGFYNALSTGALLDRRAEAQADQMLVATQILDRVGVMVPVRVGHRETGVLREFDWTLAISDRPTADMALGPILPGELAYVFVSVTPRDRSDAALVLRSVRYLETPL